MTKTPHLTLQTNITLGNYDVPSGWPTNVKFSEPGDVPGPPVQFEDDDLSEVSAGYGFESDNRQESETYFFHTDHLGSTTYLTDSVGDICQFVWYAPYGEALVDEHVADYENPFKFSGKELDDITGLYDHGARSRNPISTLWYGVDPLFEKYPDFSPYNYCAGNPVKMVDEDGREIEKESRFVWKSNKKAIIRQIERLQKRLANGKIGEDEVENTNERIGSLKNTLNNMELMEQSSQVYSLEPDVHSVMKDVFYYEGELSYDSKTQMIIIKYNGDVDQFIHEITHCSQFECGDIAFLTNGRTLAQDIFDEVSAYKAEMAYSGKAILKGIDENWILSKYADVYGSNGDAQTGSLKVTIESKSEQINKAYNLKEGENLGDGGFYGRYRNNFIFSKTYKANRLKYKY